MLQTLREHPRALMFSVVLHALVIGFALVEFSGQPVKPLVSKQGVVDQTIKAQVIDQKKLDARDNKIKQQQVKREQQQKRLKKLAEKRKLEQQKKKQQAQKKKAEAEKRRKAEALKKKQASAAKAAAKKKAEASKKVQAKRKAEQLKKKKAAQQKRKKAEAEKKRKAAEAKRKAEAAKKAKQAARKKAEKEARLAAEAEQRRKEAELKAQIAAEERQRDLDSKRNKYYRMIKSKISRNWRQPVNAGSKPLCEVRVTQGPGGIILDVTFGKCPGTREYRLSVEAAVYKSEPLPKPEDPALFDRDINLSFRP